MPGLRAGTEPYHVTLTTADGDEIGLISVDPDGKPAEFAGTLTPVDATEQFRPGGIPREWSDFSAGGGYSFFDERVPNGCAWGKNVWTMVPNAAFPSGEVTEVGLPQMSDGGTAGEIRAGFEVNGHLYLTSGRYALKVANGTATAATEIANFNVLGATSHYRCTSAVLYLEKAYWGGYDSTGATAGLLFEHTLTTDAFTSNATCTRWEMGSFYGVDGNGDWQQWLIASVASGAAFKYTNSSNPLLDTNWTPGSADGTSVGDRAFKINRIVTARQNPFFLKEEGVYSIQRLGLYRPNVTPHWANQRYTYNGVTGQIVAGRLFASILSGIDMVEGLDGELNDTPYLVHPGAELPNETPAAGITWAMCPDGDRLVAAIHNASEGNTYVCWGKSREATPGQPGLTNFIWHISPLVVEGERVTWMMRTSPDGNPRLWFASVEPITGAPHLRWMSLPRFGNPLQDLASGGPWRCRTDTTTLHLPSNPWSQGVHSEKALRNRAVVSRGASNTSYIDVFASADEASRVQLGGRVIVSPYDETRILNDVSGRQIAVSVDLKAATNQTPPVLRAATVWAGEGIRAATVYQGRFRFAQNVKLRNGAAETGDPQAKWAALLSAQGPRPATLVDWKGTTYTIAFEQGAVWTEREVKSSKDYEIDATVRFTVLAREHLWDDGARYDRAVEYT